MLFHHQYDGSPDGEAGGTKYTSRETEVALSDEAHTHHLTTYDLLYSLESFPKGISKLGTPVLNSSRIFQIALDSFDDKFDRDDFSVSTVVTSKSMMLRAAALKITFLQCSTPQDRIFQHCKMSEVVDTSP